MVDRSTVGNAPGGVGDAAGIRGFASEVEAIINAMRKGEGQLKATSKQTADLTKVFRDQQIEANKATQTSVKLVAALKELRTGNEKAQKAYGEGVKSVAADLSASVGIMTEAQAKARLSYRDNVKEMLDGAKSVGASTKDIAVLAKERANIEMEIMEDSIKEQRAMVTAYANQGGISGKARAVGAAFNANTMAMGQTVGKLGQYVGMSGAQMASLAKYAGIIGAVGLALNAVIKGNTERARLATQAGMHFDGMLSTVGEEFALASLKQAMYLRMGVKARDIQEAVIASMQDYGVGVMTMNYELENSYSSFVRGTVAKRNELIEGSAEFVAKAGAIGISLGMSLQDGAQLATKIGVLAKGGSKDTLLAFSYMGTEAKRLGVPLNAVSGIFEVLAANADHLGSTATKLTSDTFSLMKMMVEFNEKGVKGFTNVDPEKMQRAAKNLATFMVGMDEIRMAAISQQSGEGAFAALARVEGMQMGGRTNILKTLVDRFGMDTGSILDKSKQGTGESFQNAYGLAALAGFRGTPTEMANMGRMLAGVTGKGKFGQEDLLRMQGDELQKRFDYSQGIGRAMAMGADPLGVLANIATDILRILVGIAKAPLLMGGRDKSFLDKVSRDISGKGSAKESTYTAGIQGRRGMHLAPARG